MNGAAAEARGPLLPGRMAGQRAGQPTKPAKWPAGESETFQFLPSAGGSPPANQKHLNSALNREPLAAQAKPAKPLGRTALPRTAAERARPARQSLSRAKAAGHGQLPRPDAGHPYGPYGLQPPRSKTKRAWQTVGRDNFGRRLAKQLCLDLGRFLPLIPPLPIPPPFLPLSLLRERRRRWPWPAVPGPWPDANRGRPGKACQGPLGRWPWPAA